MKNRSKQRRDPRAERYRQKKRADFLKYLRQNTWLLLVAVLVLIALVLFICVLAGSSPDVVQPPKQQSAGRYTAAYVRADTPQVAYYTENMEQAGTVARGTKLTYQPQDAKELDGVTYYAAYLDGLQYGYICADNLTQDEGDVVAEQTIYVRTPQNLRLTADGTQLGALVEQGTELSVVGYDSMQNGVVHMYEVRVGGETGYISGAYTASTLEAATEIYDRFGVYTVHAAREDRYGGGDAGSLDYYPRAKGDFEDNVMPSEVRALYMTCDADVIAQVDDFIAYADSTGINAFVVNVIDGTSVGYPCEAYKTYSPTANSFANNTLEEYRAAIQKIRDAGYYVIGRITVFNDSFFVTDHPEYAISDRSGDPLYVAGSYWPSAFCRYVWEYKVELAREAVELMGFNEIQFDYVRFPDGTYRYEESGNIDFHNAYGETKAQAIQRFLMYACDELHDLGVYVGADVFGETNGTYVTSYGQYWAAISNVVDVISGMPYPDHFSQNGSYRPWEHPYETLLDWAQSAAKRQAETPTPAIARTWIQGHDAIRPPYNTYGADEIAGQIRGLEEGGLDGGFMVWHAACSLQKLETFKPAFDVPGAAEE